LVINGGRPGYYFELGAWAVAAKPIEESLFVGWLSKAITVEAATRAIKTDLVFCSQAYTPLEPGHLRRAFRLAPKKARIHDFHFHDLRHTFATRLVQSGVDTYNVQRLLGHKSPTMTQRYAHHDPESLRDGVGILDQVGTKLSHPVGSPVAASV
jgi:integrase